MKSLPWLIAIVAIILLAAVLWPWGGGFSRYAAMKTGCMSNLKQLNSALQMYGEANNGRTPPADWGSVLPIKDSRVLTCPFVQSEQKGEWGYAMNREIAGIAVKNVKDREHLVTFFETDALGPSVIANLEARVRRRHAPAGSNVAYLDGHVKFRRDEIQR